VYIVEIGNVFKSEKVAEVTTCELYQNLRKILSSYCAKHAEEFLSRIKEGLRMWRHHTRILIGWQDDDGFHCVECEKLPRDWECSLDKRSVFILVEEIDDPLWFQVRVERALEGGDWQ